MNGKILQKHKSDIFQSDSEALVSITNGEMILKNN